MLPTTANEIIGIKVLHVYKIMILFFTTFLKSLRTTRIDELTDSKRATNNNIDRSIQFDGPGIHSAITISASVLSQEDSRLHSVLSEMYSTSYLTCLSKLIIWLWQILMGSIVGGHVPCFFFLHAPVAKTGQHASWPFSKFKPIEVAIRDNYLQFPLPENETHPSAREEELSIQFVYVHQISNLGQ